MPLGRHLLDQRADLRAAGEADVVDAFVPRERVAHLMAVARHDVEGAGRKADLGRQLRHADQRQAGVFGRLHHARVARRQGAAHAAPEDLHRVVPRDDVAGNAVRLAPGEDAVAVLVGDGLAVQLVAGAGVELEVAHQRQRVGARLLDGLAAVALLDERQFVDVLGDLLRELVEQAAAVGGAHLVPDTVEAVARGAHGGVDVGRVAALDFVEGLAVGRIDDRQGAARGGRDVRVGDVVELHGAGFCAKHAQSVAEDNYRLNAQSPTLRIY